jgi:hypothetical protein
MSTTADVLAGSTLPLTAGELPITNDVTEELRSNELTDNPFIRGDVYEGIADSNGIITIKTEQRPRGVMVLESPFLCAASIAYTKNGITTIRLTRQWEFLERKEINATTNLFDFKAELRGDIDTEYQVNGYWIPSLTGTASLRMRVNKANSGDLTGDGYGFQNIAAASTSGGITLARSNGAEAQYIMFWSNLYAASGQYRFGYSLSSHTTGTATTATETQYITSKLHDDSVQFTSLGIQSTQTDDIEPGSWFDLYRRPQFNKTPLKLWVY